MKHEHSDEASLVCSVCDLETKILSVEGQALKHTHTTDKGDPRMETCVVFYDLISLLELFSSFFFKN